VYLWVQVLQTLFGFICIVEVCAKLGIELKHLTNGEVADGLYIVILGFVTLGITISLSILIMLHTYLAANAITSWEYFSWMRITYLKVWPRKYGSPFSAGTKMENFHEFFKIRRSLMAYQWRMPTRLPTL
jgi:hypothetical protein